MTTIAATILLGDAGEMVAEAIASVLPQVDFVLGINTVAGRENPTLDLARLAGGHKFRETRLLVPSAMGNMRAGWNGSFAAARNFALRAALSRGADWALTIDTDETIAWGDLDLRATVEANPEYDVYLMWRDDGHYAKERLFRLPTEGRWVGRTHEAFILTENNHRPALPGATFHERDKTPEQLAEKFARDKLALLAEIKDHPDDPRWQFYQAATYHDTGEYATAAAIWSGVAVMPGWDEQAAWAAYQAAIIYGERLGAAPQARKLAGTGLARMVTPELCWYLGYLYHRAGEHQQAILMADLALKTAVVGPARIFFRWMPAWAEKPYELLHFAHLALHGDQSGDAALYHELWQAEKEARLSSTTIA